MLLEILQPIEQFSSDCRKVLVLFLHDWLKKPTPIPTQSEATTAIVIRSHTFSRASRQLQVIT